MLPFLLVPGLNCDARIYTGLVPALWPHGPVTIANTLTGSTMAEIAAAILADAPPRFALAGFSMGGYIVFEMLRQAPGRVGKLALIDTTARPDTPEGIAKREEMIGYAQSGRFGLAISTTYPNSVHPSHLEDERIKAISRGMAEANGAETYVRHQKAIIARKDSRPDLAGIAVPTVVIVGEADKITPPDAAKEMADAIPGARLVTIPTAGHMSPVENPEAVAKALGEWARG